MHPYICFRDQPGLMKTTIQNVHFQTRRSHSNTKPNKSKSYRQTSSSIRTLAFLFISVFYLTIWTQSIHMSSSYNNCKMVNHGDDIHWGVVSRDGEGGGVCNQKFVDLPVWQCQSQTVIRSNNRTLEAEGLSLGTDRIYFSAQKQQEVDATHPTLEWKASGKINLVCAHCETAK